MQVSMNRLNVMGIFCKTWRADKYNVASEVKQCVAYSAQKKQTEPALVQDLYRYNAIYGGNVYDEIKTMNKLTSQDRAYQPS